MSLRIIRNEIENCCTATYFFKAIHFRIQMQDDFCYHNSQDKSSLNEWDTYPRQLTLVHLLW